jgi:hypothetical protein
MKFLIFGWKKDRSTLRIVQNSGLSNIKEIWKFARNFYKLNKKLLNILEQEKSERDKKDGIHSYIPLLQSNNHTN